MRSAWIATRRWERAYCAVLSVWRRRSQLVHSSVGQTGEAARGKAWRIVRVMCLTCLVLAVFSIGMQIVLPRIIRVTIVAGMTFGVLWLVALAIQEGNET